MGDSFDNAILLTESSLVSSAITSSLRNVYFKFNVVYGKQYEVTTFSSGDLYGYLYNSKMVQVAQDDDSGEGYNPLMKFTPNETGVMYFMVRAYSSSSYPSFQAQFREIIPELGTDFNNAILINEGELYTGAITRTSYTHYFTTELETGSVYRATVNITGRNAYIRLFWRPDLNSQYYNYFTNVMEFDQSNDKMYFLIQPNLTPASGERLSYTIYIEKIPLESIDIIQGGGTIYENETLVLNYSLSPKILENRTYRFQLASTNPSVVEVDRIDPYRRQIEMTGVNAGNATINVLNPGGNIIASFDITVLPPFQYEHGDGTPDNPYLVSNVAELAGIHSRLSSHYKQVADIDLSGLNWRPLGMSYSYHTETYFGGSYDGDGFKITNLTINLPDVDYCGLFSVTEYDNHKVFKNITIVNPKIVGMTYVGALLGVMDGEFYTIENCHVIGGNVEAENDVGGLVGGDWSHGYEKGALKIINCSTSCDVSSLYSLAGGLVADGRNNAHFENCFATGRVSGDYYVGGLIAWTRDYVTIKNCYATGSVHPGTEYPYDAHGGLVGGVGEENELINCYSTGYVEKHEDYESGGLVGELDPSSTITSCYYNSETSGHNDTDKGTPLTTEQMKQKASFINWDFGTVWIIDENIDYPKLTFKSIIKCIAFAITNLQIKLIPRKDG